MPKTDSLLYVDTDVLFLRPLDDIWKFFESFNSTQLAGLAPEHEEGHRGGWYNRFARHPYYPPMGRFITEISLDIFLLSVTSYPLRNGDCYTSMYW